MSILGKLSRPLTKIVYGDTSIPQEFTIGLRQPQEEITVFLHGFGAPLDVTERHTMACCAPFMMGVSLDGNGNTAPPRSGGISLQFRERGGEKRVLGVIRLATKAVVPLCGSELILFDVLGSTNYCLARVRLWAHYLPAAYSNPMASSHQGEMAFALRLLRCGQTQPRACCPYRASSRSKRARSFSGRRSSPPEKCLIWHAS